MKKYSKDAKRFYDSKAWQDCRDYYINKRVQKDGGLCEHCKSSLGYIVDHIKEINASNIDNAYITLNHDNLQYLCLDCHNKKTFSKDNTRRVIFDDDGNPMFIDDSPHKN